jgi:hypothetical protein
MGIAKPSAPGRCNAIRKLVKVATAVCIGVDGHQALGIHAHPDMRIA